MPARIVGCIYCLRAAFVSHIPLAIVSFQIMKFGFSCALYEIAFGSIDVLYSAMFAL